MTAGGTPALLGVILSAAKNLCFALGYLLRLLVVRGFTNSYPISFGSMEPSLRVVTRLPLDELWDKEGTVASVKCGNLSLVAIAALLKKGPVQFVVADVGQTLQWIPVKDCFKFWKSEARGHLSDPDSRVRLDEFPGSYGYFATEWNASNSLPIVVLEKLH